MLTLLLFAQLAGSILPADSVYASASLRELVARVTVQNHAPPAAFRGYRARVETELSLILRDTLGRERVAQTEQLSSSVQWARGGDYDMRVVGYRSQGIGVPYSALTFVQSWTEPSLFGERLRLGVGFGAATDSTRERRDPIIAVHPFASDREQYYRFTGGDTVAVLRSGGRSIPIVRVLVEPHLQDSTQFAAFEGEIDVDANRQQIVRMRGRFVVLGRSVRRPLMARLPGVVGVAFCEFVNTEVNGQYWLPAFQRTEVQSSIALLGRSRAVMRVVSQFSGYAIDDTSAVAAVSDDARRIPRHTTWAPSDSVSRFRDWNEPIGGATSSVSADDFDDLAPDAWRTTGGVLLDMFPTKTANFLRYNRVEGLYTGVEGSIRMRSVVPGLSAGVMAGFAWTERTVKGGAHVSLQRGLWTVGARGERLLGSTNDFGRALESGGGGLGAFFGSIDDADYVDRRVALGSATRVLGSLQRGLVTLQLGAGDDRAERTRLERGFGGGGPPFRPNRGVAEGGYALGTLELELHPNVTGDFVQPGFGATMHYELGRGTLRWDRAELSLAARKYWGPVAIALHADAGVVFGSVIPSQKLFELGGSGSLPGYAYKEFAGDRAALSRGQASYTFPVLRMPRRVWRNLKLPGLAPGLAAGLQSGWTEISSSGGRASVAALGGATPVSSATNGMRTTLGVGVTLFGGNAHVGVARPVDRAAPWKFVAGIGPLF